MEIIKTFESFQEYRKSDLIKETAKIEDVNEGLGSIVSAGMDKVKKYFSNKFEAFLEENPDVEQAFEDEYYKKTGKRSNFKEAAAELTDKDKEFINSTDPKDLAKGLKVTESIDGKLLFEAVDEEKAGLGDKVQTWAGLSVSGTAFASAVFFMMKAAIGAGFYTFGLPVGVLVAIAMGIAAVSGWIGQSGQAKAYPAKVKKKRAVSSQGRVNKGRRR